MTPYTGPTIYQAYFNEFKNSVTLVGIYQAADTDFTNYTIAELNAIPKITSAPVVPGDFIETTINGYPVLQMARKEDLLSVGTYSATAIIFSNATDILRIVPITPYQAAKNELCMIEAYNLYFKE